MPYYNITSLGEGPAYTGGQAIPVVQGKITIPVTGGKPILPQNQAIQTNLRARLSPSMRLRDLRFPVSPNVDIAASKFKNLAKRVYDEMEMPPETMPIPDMGRQLGPAASPTIHEPKWQPQVSILTHGGGSGGGGAGAGGAVPPPPPPLFCPPPNQLMLRGSPPSGGQPCTWVCHPRDTGGIAPIACSPQQGGGIIQGGASDCNSGFEKPGVSLTGDCRCDENKNPNSAIGQLSLKLAALCELIHSDPRAAQQVVNNLQYYASSDNNAAMFMQHYQKGLAAYDYAMSYGLCWPILAENWISEGGMYVTAGKLAAATMLGVPMLSEMAVEIQSVSGGQLLWPVAFPKAPGLNAPSAGSLHGGLSMANNIIANYIAVMRSLESRVTRARDSLSICRSRLGSGAGSEPQLLSGFVMRVPGINGFVMSSALGEATPPSSPSYEDEYMLYYLCRYPAIREMIPANASGPSAIATGINASLAGLVSYSRSIREELRQLEQAVSTCERGFASPDIPQTPQVPFPDVPTVDPNGPIQSLPNPYEDYETLPGGNGGGSVSVPGDGLTVVEDTAEKPASNNTLLALALIGIAAAMR